VSLPSHQKTPITRGGQPRWPIRAPDPHRVLVRFSSNGPTSPAAPGLLLERFIMGFFANRLNPCAAHPGLLGGSNPGPFPPADRTPPGFVE